MKSVKQFLHSFGANGRGAEKLKIAGEDDLRATMDSRPDILVSTKEDFCITNGCRPALRAPDIKMATNASGKPFPVICNVRANDLKHSKPRFGNTTSPPRSSGLRTLPKCTSNSNIGAAAADSQRPSKQAAKRPPLTLRVSSVPSAQRDTSASRSLLPPPTVTAALAKRRLDEPATDSGSPERRNGCSASQSSSPGTRTLKMSTPERPMVEQVGRGDHNVNGLPQVEGLTRIPRFGAAPASSIPSRMQKTEKPCRLRRSTSDISQASGSSSTPANERLNARPPATGAATQVLLKPAASFTTSKVSATTREEEKQVLSQEGNISTKERGKEAGCPRAPNEEPNEAAPAAKTGRDKGKSKSRCQRRIWSFSLPRFMRSHSSPKLNTESTPSEESRSSTLPRLKSADDSEASAENSGCGQGHLFKITSLTSLHGVPCETPPKTCFSQGDLNQASSDQCQRVATRKPVESCRLDQLGNATDSNDTKALCSLASSHSSSDNGTDSPERPYVMPPRALRKYIKTNFRRLNMQDGFEARTEKKQGEAILKVVIKDQPASPLSPLVTSHNIGESLTSDSSLSSLVERKHEDEELAKSSCHVEPDHLDTEVSPEQQSDHTEEVVTDHSHTASYSKDEDRARGALKVLQPSPTIQRHSPPMTCFDVDQELFSEHTGIHRAMPATVLLSAAKAPSAASTSSGSHAAPGHYETKSEIPDARCEVFVGDISTSREAAFVARLPAATNGNTQGQDQREVADGCVPAAANSAQPEESVDVLEALDDRLVDGASCSESISSFESELPDKQERRTAHSRKLKVLDKPSGVPGGAPPRKPVPGCCSTSAPTCFRRNKRHLSGVQQLENEVWQAERQLLLLKEKVRCPLAGVR
ncbi:uncharacterized protein LOC144179399 [Haemaphysalis longicornis]